MRPKFIVLEGIDGSGKSLVAKKLKDHLESKNIKTKITAEPTESIIGDLVKKSDYFPPEVEALLFTADRALHTRNIKSWMREGYTVISDRYVGSDLAYQSASGEDIEWLKNINDRVIIQPDFTFLLDIDPKVSHERINARSGEKNRFESFDYQVKVRAAYLKLLDEYNYIKIDAARPPDDTVQDIISIILRAI